MNENKPRKLVYIEKHSEPSQMFSGNEVWYECPECGKRYDWLDRNRGGSGNRFCAKCGNYLSWAKVDLENYKETVSDFDKSMPLWQFLQDPKYGHAWEHDVSMTFSHSEKDILDGCIALMQELCDDFKEYLDFIGFEPETDEEKEAYVSITYFHIVQRLFLWKTCHAGGTSTGMKLKNLGVDDYDVKFRFWEEEQEDE